MDAADIPPDALVQSFLKAAKASSVSALVVYGFSERGKPHMRMSANVSGQAVTAVFTFLTKTDEKAVDAAARAIVESMGGRPWDELPENARHAFHKHAHAALLAARTATGAKLLGEEPPPVV